MMVALEDGVTEGWRRRQIAALEGGSARGWRRRKMVGRQLALLEETAGPEDGGAAGRQRWRKAALKDSDAGGRQHWRIATPGEGSRKG